jgi:CBS domain-containing protein
MRVEELMTRDVVSVSEDTSLKDVAVLLGRHRISGVPVCSATGAVVGVVSEADLIRKEEGLDPSGAGLFTWLFGGSEVEAAKIAARTAGEAMTAPVVTIEPGEPVAAAAKLMVERRINRLPVVTGGRLAGIVTRADLVRAFSRSDDEIEREIAEDVLLNTLWVAPESVELEVSEGHVSIRGRVDSRTLSELIVGYVRRVPGVVDVDADLTWQVDDLARRTSTARLPKRL